MTNKYFSKNEKIGNHQPDFVASSVLDIDYQFLKSMGVKCVAYDIDGTLTKNGSESMNPELAKSIKQKLDESKIITRYLASNSIRSLAKISNLLGAFEIHQPISSLGKPSARYYEQLVKKTGYQPQQIAMIGDRLLQDTWGANRVGLVTVLVALNPEYATFRDKIVGRQLWQPIFVKLKSRNSR